MARLPWQQLCLHVSDRASETLKDKDEDERRGKDKRNHVGTPKKFFIKVKTKISGKEVLI